MSRRGLWAIGLGLACGVWAGGCQSTGASGDAESRAPSFGVDRIPRQSEPEIEATDVERRETSSRPGDDEIADESETSVKESSLLTRLLPGRDKDKPGRKALPVNKRSAGIDSDEADDDDFKF